MTDNEAALARIEGKIDLLTERVSTTVTRVEDHETRLRGLEQSHHELASTTVSKKAIVALISVIGTLAVSACAIVGLLLR